LKETINSLLKALSDQRDNTL